MAIVIGSKFKPFDYATMSSPVIQATQEHKELENAYGELSTKASVWEGLANQQADPRAYQTYMQYANDLQDQANILAKQGLNPMAKRALNDMKSRYVQEITPIEQAYQKRDALTAEQRQALLKNPTIIFDKDFSTISLDDLIANPSMSYRNINGDIISQNVAQAASNLARTLRTDPRRWKGILNNEFGPQYYETLMKSGMSPEEILATISNSGKVIPELQQIIDDEIKSTGVMEWNSPEALEQVRSYANKGLWASIGQDKYETLKANMPKVTQTGASGSTGTPIGLHSMPLKEIAKEMPEVLKGLNAAKAPDGTLNLTNESMEAKKKELKDVERQIKFLDEELKNSVTHKPSTRFDMMDPENKNSERLRLSALQAKAESIKRNMADVQGQLMETMRKYSSLGDDPQKAIELGKSIDKGQLKTQYDISPMITSRDSGDKIDVLKSLTKMFKAIPDSQKTGLIELDDNFRPDKGGYLKASKAKSILADENTGIGVVPGVGIVVTKGNDKYVLGGVSSINDVTYRMEEADKFLGGFTDGKIPRDQVPDLSSFNYDPNNVYQWALKNGVPVGENTGMIGVMVKDEKNNDLNRIVFKPRSDGGLDTFMSSALDETVRGKIRREAVVRMVMSELPYILEGLEGLSRPSGTMSSKEKKEGYYVD